MKNKEILFFLPAKTINEATIYYVDMLKEAFIEAGYKVFDTESLSDLKNYNNIFVMSAKWCFIVKLMHPRARIVTWFQGLGGEEALMTRNSIIRKRLWNCVELFAMKYSWLNIYVSMRMRKYYCDTYKIIDKNFFIIPCFNKQFNFDSLSVVSKYNNPTFVYAGGLDKWQCIEETLKLFSLIEKDLPNANLTILTKDIDKAKELVNKFLIKNFKVDFVPLKNLDEELKKYKYGFIIRDDHIVNNVSTPTKMNSYLANGIIPIYTNVIDDFNQNLNLKNCGLILDVNDRLDAWKKDIINFENVSKNSEFKIRVESEIEEIFGKYYNRESYINELQKYLKKIG
ncbi:TPA: hypothetical protein U9I82_002881 [Acinetobacter baumannii]|uniref:hypothetical protein n=1 Tax=Acinetobacter baumannii TaxID=470 RepID=UPI00244CFA98|nr:hypothetical protein [Acinetobacter baumannii]MDH2604489.1 hypothetical protein [Acinetobacter baumannii]HEN9524451.1 hypothetical protein [Acinetobacter baumannii]HEN9532279.1 hypothetical protein [Acinetobacter baumannii]HEN9567575.1 hypothetical protein [Acinetobacter baumannii]HEN9576074.1 hypothetical protein [Acinetobacter baumannii]